MPCGTSSFSSSATSAGRMRCFGRPPFSFIGLLTRDGARLKKCLELLKGEWSCLMRLEEAALQDDEAASFVKNLLVPGMTFCRETYIRLYEVQFEHVPDDLKRDLTDFAQSHLSSLIVECAFNESRRVSGHNRGARQGGAQLWHLTTLGSGLGDNFGRPSVRPSASAKVASCGRLPKGIFVGSAVEGSMPAETLDEITTPRPAWPTPSPATFKSAAIAWQVVRSTQGLWQENKNSWLSLLMTPGTVVLHRQSQHAKMVLEPRCARFLAWALSGCATGCPDQAPCRSQPTLELRSDRFPSQPAGALWLLGACRFGALGLSGICKSSDRPDKYRRSYIVGYSETNT